MRNTNAQIQGAQQVTGKETQTWMCRGKTSACNNKKKDPFREKIRIIWKGVVRLKIDFSTASLRNQKTIEK